MSLDLQVYPSAPAPASDSTHPYRSSTRPHPFAPPRTPKTGGKRMEGLAAGSGTPGPPTRLAITAANGTRNATWTHVVWPMPSVVGFLLVFWCFCWGEVGVGLEEWEWGGLGDEAVKMGWRVSHLYYCIFFRLFSVSFSYLCTSNEYLFLDFLPSNQSDMNWIPATCTLLRLNPSISELKTCLESLKHTRWSILQ